MFTILKKVLDCIHTTNNFFLVLTLAFKWPVFTYVKSHKTPLQIHFAYLGSKESYYVFKACCLISVLFFIYHALQFKYQPSYLKIKERGVLSYTGIVIFEEVAFYVHTVAHIFQLYTIGGSRQMFNVHSHGNSTCAMLWNCCRLGEVMCVLKSCDVDEKLHCTWLITFKMSGNAAPATHIRRPTDAYAHAHVCVCVCDAIAKGICTINFFTCFCQSNLGCGKVVNPIHWLPLPLS